MVDEDRRVDIWSPRRKQPYIIQEKIIVAVPDSEVLLQDRYLRMMSKAQTTYDSSALGSFTAENVCTHPDALHEAHERGLKQATTAFVKECMNISNDEEYIKSEKNKCIKNLKKRYKDIQIQNEKNNDVAVKLATDVYHSVIEELCPQPCMPEATLIKKHEEAKGTALDKFKIKRHPYTEFNKDLYMAQLLAAIDAKFDAVKNINNSNNQAAIREAIWTFDVAMKAICGPKKCLHPEDLVKELKAARPGAIQIFNLKRAAPINVAEAEEFEDDYKSNLIEELSQHIDEMKTLNDAKNAAALLDAYMYYINRVESVPEPTISQLLGGLFSIPPTSLLQPTQEEYGNMKKASLDRFKGKRQRQTEYTEDLFLDKLNNLILKFEYYHKELSNRFDDVKVQNDLKNSAAVLDAYEFYIVLLETTPEPELDIRSILTEFSRPTLEGYKSHRDRALDRFKEHRLDSNHSYAADAYREELDNLITTFEHYHKVHQFHPQRDDFDYKLFRQRRNL